MVNRAEYMNFMRCSRGVMRRTLNRMQELSEVFIWSDEDTAEAIGCVDTVTAFASQFYGRKPSLPERRIFEDMYRRKA